MLKKLFNQIKKDYKYVNITLIVLAIYVIFFPVISSILEKINPNLVKCVYLSITGKECPLCGGTRYIRNFRYVFKDITYLFDFFAVIISVILFNIIFRIANLVKIRKGKDMELTIKIDLTIHSILLILYLGYEIIFLIK